MSDKKHSFIGRTVQGQSIVLPCFVMSFVSGGSLELLTFNLDQSVINEISPVGSVYNIAWRGPVIYVNQEGTAFYWAIIGTYGNWHLRTNENFLIFAGSNSTFIENSEWTVFQSIDSLTYVSRC